MATAQHATNPPQGTRLFESGLLSRESLAALIVSPERAEEIMRLYPEDEMRGRPGLFAPSEKTQGGKIRKPHDALDDVDEAGTWSTTVEFADGPAEQEELVDEAVDWAEEQN